MAQIDMVMPQMGESIAEGTIIKWLKKEGEKVQRDETILEISTDKVDSEIPSPASGIIAKILVEEGKTVNVGTPIAQIETDVSAAGNGKAKAPEAEPPAAKKAPAEPVKQPEHPIEAAPSEEEEAVPAEATTEPAELPQDGGAARQGKRFYSPLVRSIAKQENIPMAELEQVPGSGAAGRVTKNDILAYLKQRVAPAPSQEAPRPPISIPAVSYDQDRVEIVKMDNMRRRIAEHMVLSKQTSPHVYSVSTCDMTRIVQYRERVRESFEKREGTKLTFTPFFIDATVRAIRDFPMINSVLDGDKIVIKKYINIGVAVALDNGLIVPVIKNADTYNMVGLARATNDIALRARNKQLKPDEVQGGTFSITNMGAFGNLFGIPIINQPQVAILGIGAIKKTPVVIGEGIAIRDLVYLSLSYDHRIIDGAYGGQFLQRIVENLERFELAK